MSRRGFSLDPVFVRVFFPSVFVEVFIEVLVEFLVLFGHVAPRILVSLLNVTVESASFGQTSDPSRRVEG